MTTQGRRRLRRSDCSLAWGFAAEAAWARVHVRGRGRGGGSATGEAFDALIPRPRDPSRMDGRVDLPGSARAPSGDGHRCRRAQAVPLPPDVARAGATARSPTGCATPLGERFCRSSAVAPAKAPAHRTSLTHEAGAGVPRCGCSTWGCSGSGASSTRRMMAGSGSPTIRPEHVAVRDRTARVRLPGEGRRARRSSADPTIPDASSVNPNPAESGAAAAPSELLAYRVRPPLAPRCAPTRSTST